MIPADRLQALLLAVAKPDRRAFQDLYAAISPKLYAIALRICRDTALAEEALQEAFVDIWRRADSFDPAHGKAEAWLVVIARNRAIDAVRQRARRPSEPGLTPSPEMLDLPDPSTVQDGGTDYLALMACLNRLDGRSREAVLRAYYRGETREDLAAHFAVPVNTVKTWLRRALASLRACLDE